MAVASVGIGDGRLDEPADVRVAQHEVAVGVLREVAGPGVIRGAVGIQDLEEAGALNGDVQLVAGLLHRALGEVVLDAFDAAAHADVDAGGRVLARAVLLAGILLVLVDEVLEIRPPFLNAVVSMFARLLAMTSSLVCREVMPVAAV